MKQMSPEEVEIRQMIRSVWEELTAELRLKSAQVGKHHAAILRGDQDAADHAFSAGQLLVDIKKILKRGIFHSYVLENCGLIASDADRYVLIFRRAKRKSIRIAQRIAAASSSKSAAT